MMKGWLSGIKNAVAAISTSAPGSGDPLALEIREKWSKVQRFYMTVQNCDNESHMSKYAEQLPEIDHTMNCIVELLVKDRHNTAQKRAQALQDAHHLSQSADEYPSDRNAAAPMSSMTSLSLESVDGEQDNTTMSPCYELLLGLNASAAAAGAPSPGDRGGGMMRFGLGGPAARAFTSTPGSPGGTSGVVSESGGGSGVLAGCEIIVRACQFAKHDQPRGSRRIMLHFLARLYGEADLPNKGQSLLQYGEEVTKPTLDLIAKVESQLDPRKIVPTTAATDKKKKSASATVDSVGEDHLAFVELLSVLCLKVEQLPSIFAYFITTNADHHWQTKKTTPQKSELAVAGGTHIAVAHLHCFLVDYLLPYVGGNFPATSLSEAQQVKLTRVTLSGLLSLLKTTDGAVQTTMQAEERILMWLESQLRRSVLTLVMLPPPSASSPNKSNNHNQGNNGSGDGVVGGTSREFRVMVQNATEMLRFMDALVMVAPTVNPAGEGSSHATMCETVLWEFLQTTYDRLLRSTEERTFTAAASMYRIFLQTATTEPLLNLLGGFLLLPRPTVNVSRGNEGGAGAASSSSGVVHPPPDGKSLFDCSVVPKLRDLSVPVSCAALSLTNAVITRCPSLFMRAVLGMHPRKSSNTAPPSPSPEGSVAAVAGAGGIADAPGSSIRSAWQDKSFAYYHDTRPLFCAELVSDSVVCGTPASGFVHEVHAKYLGIESMLSSADWADYRARFSTQDAVSSGGGLMTHQHQQQEQQSHHQGTMLGKLNPSFDICPKCLNQNHGGDGDQNVLSPSCQRLQKGSTAAAAVPFLTQLGECLSGMLEQPFTINTLVTQVWVSVLLLPHPLIAISLLQRNVEEGGEGSNPKKNVGALANHLMKLSARIDKIFSSEAQGEPFSRLSLYRRQVGRPFFDAGEGNGKKDGEGGSAPLDAEDSFSIAMRQSKRFVEGCVVLEGFRHELSACLTWHEMGRSLTQLQPVDPFSQE